jgi:hypothetical protein
MLAQGNALGDRQDKFQGLKARSIWSRTNQRPYSVLTAIRQSPARDVRQTAERSSIEVVAKMHFPRAEINT